MAGWEDILLDHSEKSQEETQIKSEHFNYEVILTFGTTVGVGDGRI